MTLEADKLYFHIQIKENTPVQNLHGDISFQVNVAWIHFTIKLTSEQCSSHAGISFSIHCYMLAVCFRANSVLKLPSNCFKSKEYETVKCE